MKPDTVVVGLCAHGLAIVRSLSNVGARVVALESNAKLPGVRTKRADVVLVDDLTGSHLIDVLKDLAPRVSKNGKPVLFLTNDRMTQTVGEHVNALLPLYRLSWGDACERLLPLLSKSTLAQRCAEVGLLFPHSRVIDSEATLNDAAADIGFPIIIKPVRPLSSYKTIILQTSDELAAAWQRIANDDEAIVQRFITGKETDLYFAALYLRDGRIISRYEGQKLRSRPLGHTTVAIGAKDDAVHALAQSFFAGLGLSGPVSLELKKDSEGRFWVIEPTVGRTDFWMGVCSADGINLPQLEYEDQIGVVSEVVQQRDRTVWINGERDSGAALWLLRRFPRLLFSRKMVGVYFDLSDMRPFMAFFGNRIAALPRRVLNRLSPG